MANVKACIVVCVKHLVYLIVSFNIDSSSAMRYHWANFKGKENRFRKIKYIVLQYQRIRLGIQGLSGLGQTERKLVHIYL